MCNELAEWFVIECNGVGIVLVPWLDGRAD